MHTDTSEKAPEAAGAAPTRLWLYLVFLVSGFAALLYQVVWQRALYAIYGINIESVTMVVTAFMLGLGLTYLAASGVNIWLARRRDKGRPAPGWERIWSATIWGQPASIAGAAVASLIMGETAAAIGAWAILSVAFWLLAFRFDARGLGKVGRIATGVLMLLVVGVHLALRGGAASADAVAWIVNAGFLLGGLALLAPDLRRAASSGPAVVTH